MKLMAAFWLLLIPQLVFSQARTVLDKHSNLPVAYATVKVLQQKKGTITSEQGRFELELNENDSLLVSCVGYQTKIIRAGEERIIYLEPKAAILNEVTVTNRKTLRTLRLGYSGKIPRQVINWGPSENKEEFAQKIELPAAGNYYRLKRIYLPVKNLNCEGTLLLSIYEEDTVSGFPGEAIFVRPVKAVTHKKMLAVDIAAEDIIIYGRRSFYISLGWLPGAATQNCVATILMSAAAGSSTFSRTLTSPTFNWVLFGTLKGGNKAERQWNTMYAVDVEECIKVVVSRH